MIHIKGCVIERAVDFITSLEEADTGLIHIAVHIARLGNLFKERYKMIHTIISLSLNKNC